MAKPHHLTYLLLLLLGLTNLTLAAAPLSFCKCTCFANSTIIPLNDAALESPDAKTRTCNDCTKNFCLSYNLPICRDAEESDVLTQCFQRDSRKDEIVVFIFIFATVGLLLYAAVKPWVDKWKDNTRDRQSYAPLNGRGES